VASKSNDVAVFRGTRRGFNGGNFLIEILLSGLDQSPHDIRIRGVRRSPAEAVEGPGVPAEAAIPVAPGKKPGTGTIEHILVHTAYPSHVGELHQTISRERFVAGIGPEPFVALRAGFKACQLLIGDFEQAPGLLDDGGVDAGVREEVLLSHDHRIAGGTGLLETAVRL